MYIKGKPWTNMKVALYKDRTKTRPISHAHSICQELYTSNKES